MKSSFKAMVLRWILVVYVTTRVMMTLTFRNEQGEDAFELKRWRRKIRHSMDARIFHLF